MKISRQAIALALLEETPGYSDEEGLPLYQTKFDEELSHRERMWERGFSNKERGDGLA